MMLRAFLTPYLWPSSIARIWGRWPNWHPNLLPNNHAVVAWLRRSRAFLKFFERTLVADLSAVPEVKSCMIARAARFHGFVLQGKNLFRSDGRPPSEKYRAGAGLLVSWRH